MTVVVLLMPLTNVPQTFTISMNGVDYILTVKWNDASDAGWMLDIADSDSNPIACGLPLITGADVLAGLGYLGIGGSLVVFTDGDPSAVPTLENLGDESNVYFITEQAANG